MAGPILPDDLWERIEPLLPKSRRNRHVQHAGRKPVEDRKAMTGILFVLKTGVPWRELPATSDWPSGHTCRRRLVRWHRAGVWKRLYALLLSALRAAHKIDWRRAVVDSASVRAPSGGRNTGPNPTDRRKLGTKHHIITDAEGTPLAVLLTGANRNDITQLLPLIAAIVPITGQLGRPRKRPDVVLGDRGYDSESHRRALKKARHFPTFGETKNEARKPSWKETVRRGKNIVLVSPIQKVGQAGR